MLKQAISVCMGAAVWVAVAAGEAKPELLGSVEFASFDEVQQKMANLGATINNPVVPMLTMPAGSSTVSSAWQSMKSAYWRCGFASGGSLRRLSLWSLLNTSCPR